MDKDAKDIKLIKTLFSIILILIGVAVAAILFWVTNEPRIIQSNNIQYMGRGDTGMNAYELARVRGFEGTQDDWLASLKGQDGVTTIINKEEKTVVEVPAEPAKDGVKGDSAYDIWLDQGNTGTKQDFLDSLVPQTLKDVRQYRFNEITNKMETKLESEFRWVSIPYCGVSKPCL